MKKETDSFCLLSSRILVLFAAVACTVERAFGGAKYVYRGIKREDGNSQSGVRLSCGIDYTRFRPYGYGWELRRLAG